MHLKQVGPRHGEDPVGERSLPGRYRTSSPHNLLRHFQECFEIFIVGLLVELGISTRCRRCLAPAGCAVPDGAGNVLAPVGQSECVVVASQHTAQRRYSCGLGSSQLPLMRLRNSSMPHRYGIFDNICQDLTPSTLAQQSVQVVGERARAFAGQNELLRWDASEQMHGCKVTSFCCVGALVPSAAARELPASNVQSDAA